MNSWTAVSVDVKDVNERRLIGVVCVRWWSAETQQVSVVAVVVRIDGDGSNQDKINVRLLLRK